MKKVITIDRCDDCPNFDNAYYGYDEKCRVLNRKIERIKMDCFKHSIPLDCPLPDSEE